MKKFTELCSLLSQASNAEYKEILFSEYIDSTPESDVLWAIYILSGRKLNKYINTGELWNILPELAEIPQWLIEESLMVSGDKTETISLLLKDNYSDHKISLAELMNEVDGLSEYGKSHLTEMIINTLKKLSSAEKYLFLKLISGNFHPPVKLNVIANVLSGKYKLNKLSVYHLLSTFDVHNCDLGSIISSYKKNKNIYKTYRFKSSVKTTIEDITEINSKNWFAEWKWDGIRAQIIYRNGEFMVWSKDEKLISEKFPEFFELSKYLPNGIVLDGEIIAFSSGKPLPHNMLAGRLNKKFISIKIINENPAVFIAFDLLEYEGKKIINRSLGERRTLLEDVVEKLNQTGRIFISPLLEFRTLNALNDIKNSAAENNCKGVILKKKNSEYNSSDNWFCIPIEKYSINGVLLYAQRDLRSDFYKELTFGVWNNDELITFTKAIAEFESDALTELKAFINDNTLEKFGPVRTVKPELVFEIKFDGISESLRHKSGIVLRNPAIHHWHKDMKSHDAGHLSHLKEILKNAG